MISIQIQGSGKVINLMRNLPKQLNKEVNMASGEWMKSVKKSAKLRAPRDTGELAASIILVKEGSNWVLQVQSPYGYYQEYGFAPHWVNANMSTENGLGTIGSAFNIAGFAFVKKFTPFIQPSIEANLPKLPKMLSESTLRAIQESKK